LVVTAIDGDIMKLSPAAASYANSAGIG